MAQREAREYEIIGGPSKFDLMTSLFSDTQVRVEFLLKPLRKEDDYMKIPYVVVIDGAEREDGSGESWNIKGRILAPDCAGKPIAFSGSYSSKLRNGHFTYRLPE